MYIEWGDVCLGSDRDEILCAWFSGTFSADCIKTLRMPIVLSHCVHVESSPIYTLAMY